MTSLWISAPAPYDHAELGPPHRRVAAHAAGRPRVAPPPPRRRSAAPMGLGVARAVLAVLVVTVLAMGATEVASRLGRAMVSSPATQLGGVSKAPVIEHRAEAGETLWSLAATLGPSGDVRAALDQLIRLNGASGVVEGQLVLLPSGWFEQADR